MALADIAFMRGFANSTDSLGNPAITILMPSDAVSAYSLVLQMAAFPSACYLPAVRADLPLLYEEDAGFQFGGHKVLRGCGSAANRVIVAACGYRVQGTSSQSRSFVVLDAEFRVIDINPPAALYFGAKGD